MIDAIRDAVADARAYHQQCRSCVESPFASFEELEREALACTKCPLAARPARRWCSAPATRTPTSCSSARARASRKTSQGIPFVGRAGRLLTSLIEGIGLDRDEVYIANVVKCRPPGNRDPLPLEIETVPAVPRGAGWRSSTRRSS